MNVHRPLWRAFTATVGSKSLFGHRQFSQFPLGTVSSGHDGSSTGSKGGTTAAVPLPYITEVTTGGWRTYDIFSKLLQERIVLLNGAINDTLSASIVAQLLWLESDNPDKPITMYIQSPGGSIVAGLAIYDTMSYIQPAVSTVCLGQAASMGSLLLCGGHKGKRYALPHSSIMVHQPLGGTEGQAADILIYAAQMQKTRGQLNEIYRRHLNDKAGFERWGLQEVEDMMDRDKYLSAHEAVEIGLVDEILTRRPGKQGEQRKEGEGEGDGEGEKKE